MVIIQNGNCFYNTKYIQNKHDKSNRIYPDDFHANNPITDKSNEAIRNTVFGQISFKQKNHLTDSKACIPVSDADKNAIADIITERYSLVSDYYDIPQKDIDWNIQMFLSSIKTTADAKFAKAALLKQIDGRNLYTCAETADLIARFGENGVSDTAVEAVEKSDEKLTPNVLLVLQTLKEEDSEKYYLLIKSKYLMRYLCNSLANQNQNNLVLTSEISFLPKLEDICKFVSESKISEDNFARLTDLYLSDKSAYDYAVSSPVLCRDFLQSPAFSASENIGLNELKEIEKACIANTSSNSYVKMYVIDSDFFRYGDELSEYLSEFKTDGDITVYRSERDTGMFENVSLDNSELEQRIREINEANKTSTKKEKIVPNSRTFRKYEQDKVTLYDYINSKSELNLSDAMLMVKYADEDFEKDVLAQIESCSIQDCRFKSASFSKSFADYWAKVVNGKNAVTVKETLTIKKGTEGAFCSKSALQSEFILNNKPKLFRYQKAAYDRTSNTFILEAVVQNI